MPRVKDGISEYPYPNSGDPAVTTVDREWRWPRVTKKDVVVEYRVVPDSMRGPRYSLEHLTDRGQCKITVSRYSVAAGICNLAVLVSGVLMKVILIRAMRRRQFTLEAMLATTTALAGISARFVYDDALAAWDPLLLEWHRIDGAPSLGRLSLNSWM